MNLLLQVTIHSMKFLFSCSNQLKHLVTISVPPTVAAAGVAADEEDRHAFLAPRRRLRQRIKAWWWWLSGQAGTMKL